MEITIIDYILLYSAVFAVIIISYRVILFAIKYVQWLLLYLENKKSYDENENIPLYESGIIRESGNSSVHERRFEERRKSVRRVFNRGFYLKRGFFDNSYFDENMIEGDIFDRRGDGNGSGQRERRFGDRRAVA